MNKKYADFQQGGYVSIWIGNVVSDAELDAYLNKSSGFENEFGFTLNEADMPETTVESEPMPIERLVDGFSWSRSYQAAVVEAACKLGYEIANSMVVLHNFKFDPTEVRVRSSTKLVFVGSFPFS